MKGLLSYTAVGLVLGFGAFAVAQNVSNYMEQGGARWVIGGSLDVASGGDLDIESGASLKLAGTAISVTAAELNDSIIQIHVEDISVASTFYAVSHFIGSVTDWYCVLNSAFSGSDVTLALSVNGAQPTNNGTLTVTTSGSAAGEVDSAAVTGANSITRGQVIGIGSNGNATQATVEMCTVVIER